MKQTKKKQTIKTVLAAGAIALAAPASAAVVTIDFDSTASGFYGTSDNFSGLVFDRDIQVLSASSSQAAPGPGQTGQIARQSTPPFGAQPRGQSIGGSFDGFTVSTLSFVVGDSGGDIDIFNLQGFDAMGNLVTQSGEQQSPNAITVGIAGTGIASFFLFIEDEPAGFDGSSFFDNITFNTELSAVPVPASLPLLGAGMLAFGFAARRRKQA